MRSGAVSCSPRVRTSSRSYAHQHPLGARVTCLTIEAGMARLLLLARRPDNLSREEAEVWLRREVRRLDGSAGIERVSITRLGPASLRWGRSADWLIELEVPAWSWESRALCEDACAALVGDMRLLGMKPVLAVADEQLDLREGDAAPT
jgi:hypothetical protein